ncbi:MAG: hypothetical protein ACTINZ_11875 [Microbacterium gubbeenense]|uniref:hypothetical protein n=1 Tax=Microbacterium gubbeenense TaxID=159896 RepID=UPI003F9C1AA7
MTNLDFSPRQMRFDLSTSTVNAALAPLDFHHPVLAAELADALLHMHRSFGQAGGTAYNYRRAIVSLLRGLPESCPRTVGLGTPESDLVEALHEWELSLATAYPPESTLPNKRGRQIRRLIQIHEATGHAVNDSVLGWAQGGVLHHGGEETPLDEFTNAERLAIRDDCRNRIRALEARLVIGRRFLALGSDPRPEGWVRASDVLWAVRNLGRAPQASIYADVIKASADGVLQKLSEDFASDHATTPGGGHRVMRRLMSYLYPSDTDLVAFRTLLQLETGAAPEEWSRVTLGDIEPATDAIHVRLHKARAHRSRTVRFALTSAGRRNGWRAGDLLRRLQAATEHARDEATEIDAADADALFLTAHRTTTRHVAVRTETFSRRPFSSLLATISPAISRPYDARRLRKTVKSVRAAVLRSADVAAGDDHSVEVFQRHYAQSTTVHVLAGAAVNAAQQQVFTRLQRGPVFVNAPANAIDRDIDEVVSAAADAEMATTPTDRAMNVAHCASPYESPFSPAGRLCEHRPSMCFACPNAIVFTDHLPRLLAYREVLRGHEKEMPPAQFAVVYGQQVANIEQILDEFSPEHRDQASRDLDGLNERVHIPLSQRGVHL